jgi:hypothetical protein
VFRPLVRACLVIAFAGAGLALSPNVAVAASSGNIVVSTTAVTDASGETLTTVTTKTYSSRGDLVSNSMITTNAAEEIVRSDVTTATYGTAGRVLSSTQVRDVDGPGGVPASITISTLSYDKSGLLTKLVTTIDTDSDGDLESTQTQTFGRDRKDRTSTEEYNFGGGVVTITNTYNAQGNVILTVTETDTLDPTAMDFRSTYTATYTMGQLATEHTLAEDLNPDGTTVSTATQDSTNTYDSRGNLVGNTSTLDSNADGVVDSTNTNTQVFDSKGRVVHSESVSASPAFPGSPTVSVKSDYAYDTAGREVSNTTQVLLDGVLASGQVTTKAYDSKGRLVSQGSTDLVDAQTSTITNTYDAKGRMSVSLTENRAGSGALTYSELKTFTYTKTTVTTTTKTDSNGDTFVDLTVVTTTAL